MVATCFCDKFYMECSRNNSHILNCHMCNASVVWQVAIIANLLPFSFQIYSVTIIARTNVHHTFAVETFFKTGKFVTATQRAFHAHFMLYPNDNVLDRKFYLDNHYSSLIWNVTLSQFLSGIMLVRFKVFLLQDWLPNHSVTW